MPPLKIMAQASRDQSSLGNLILKEGILGHDELSELLVEFNELKVEELLGQFLVRKGVLSQEKLELLLIRQSAARDGGVERKHVKQAMAIAQRTSQAVLECADGFVSDAQAALAKASEAK